MRKCPDCSRDISHRNPQAIRCVHCAAAHVKEINRESNVRYRAKKPRPAIKKERRCANGCGADLTGMDYRRKYCDKCGLEVSGIAANQFQMAQVDQKQAKLLNEMNPKRWTVEVLASRMGYPLEEIRQMIGG